MRLRIDRTESVPAVRQIADQLRVLLVEGKLKPGDALPPVRRVAMELHVHFNTVAEAYRQLAEEGLLEIAHGRAAKVRAWKPGIAMESDWRSFRARLRALVAEMRARGLDEPEVATELRAMADEMEGVTP